MTQDRVLEVLQRFADVVALAGLKGTIETEGRSHPLYVGLFNVSDQRRQFVYARALPNALGGKDVVHIYSPSRVLKKGFRRGLEKDQALHLLRVNSELMMARYHLSENDEEQIVMASVDLLLDTLDPEEVKAYFWLVAMAADSYERELGVDQF